MNKLKLLIEAGKKVLAAARAVAVNPASYAVNVTGKLVREHKAIRRGTLLWVLYLVTHATIKVFQNPIAITTPEAAAYATVTALLGVAIGFYNASRNQDPPK